MVTITEKEYVDLLLAQEMMSRLEIGGVDNWEWYGESLNPDDAEDIDTFEKKLKEQYGI